MASKSDHDVDPDDRYTLAPTPVVIGDLILALDWRKKRGEVHGRYSYRRGGAWYVVQYGPGFSITFRVTHHDDAGLASLLKLERKEESGEQDRTLRP